MPTRSRFEIGMLAAFAAALLLVGALAVVTWQASRESEAAAQSVAHTREVIGHLDETKFGTLLIEFSTQSYRLSGNAEQLAQRDAAIAAREIALRRLKDLTADNAGQQARWAQLRAVADERLALSRQTELLFKTEGAEAASAFAAQAPLWQTRERLYAVLGAMVEEEQRLLRERRAEQEEVRELRTAIGAVMVLLLAVLVPGSYGLIRRQFAERRRVEAELRASEESLATTLHSIGDAVLATDTEGRIVRMNPVAERLTGWPIGQARGRAVDEVFCIINETTRAPAEVPVARVLATGDIHGLANHTVLIARDGSECAIADSAAPVRDAAGRVSGVVLVFRDVTDDRSAERLIREHNGQLEQRVGERTAQLQASQGRLKAVVDNLGEGVIVADLEGRVLDFNRAAVEMHGFSESSEYLLRLPEFAQVFEFTTLDGSALPLDQWPLARVLRGETLRDVDLVLRRLGSDWHKVFSYGGTLMNGADGRPALALVAVRDITARMHAEQEIVALNASLERRVAERTAQLEAANRAKSDFLANMSHELRTPLNSIIGFSEMLKDGVLGKLDTKQRGFVADIFDAGTHLLGLINDILDLSKVEAGMLQLELRAVDVAALCKASTLVVREKALACSIRLDTRIDPMLGTLPADERKLKQILYNLLSNAVKFSPDGGTVTLLVGRCSRAEVALPANRPGRLLPLPPGEDDEFLAIAVEDSGAGIAEHDLQKLFEPFMQVDSSVARRHAGTGLGLSLVRRLAELHGGTVGVTSRAGQGSRFCVWLPLREAPDGHVDAGWDTLHGALDSRPAPLADVPLALVVEDDDRMADLISQQLHAEGFEVMRAATAEEGLVRAAKRRPQLITLDIFLPAMDGWEFMRRLKAHPQLADTPVVIITVSDELDHALALGARRVLQKPFVRQELTAALAGLIDAPPGGATPRVLVVDDNPKAVELLATMLAAEGYGVLHAYSGAEAIEAARRALPDLVILDLMMPGVSGFEVAQALRESEATARIPILVLTAKDLSAAERLRLNGDVGVILAKSSFSHSELLAELRRALPRP